MKALAAIAVGTSASHLVGSLVLSCILGGPVGILVTPIMAIFGWPFIIPEAVGALLQWCSYQRKGKRGRILFLVIWAVLAGALVAPIGPKEQGSEVRWIIGYAIGAGAAAIASGLVVQFFKHIDI